MDKLVSRKLFDFIQNMYGKNGQKRIIFKIKSAIKRIKKSDI